MSALKLDKIRVLAKNTQEKHKWRLWSYTTVGFQFQKQQRESPGGATARAEAPAGDGFQALTVKRLLMSWIILRDPDIRQKPPQLQSSKQSGQKHWQTSPITQPKTALHSAHNSTCQWNALWCEPEPLLIDYRVFQAIRSLNWKWNRKEKPSNPNAFYHEKLSFLMLTVENYFKSRVL